MEIIRDIAGMKSRVGELKRQGKRIGLVPTMGYLHEGHLSLMRLARERADVVVASIFVNPTQFGPNEDLDTYPRDFERDERLARETGVDMVFYPDVKEMYPQGFRTYVEVEDWGHLLCGESRPIHFRGVCTVVLKLFNSVRPDVAVFGWKDAQQFLILRRMVLDLDLDIEMIGGDLVREPDGLAMSSRNRYLNREERRAALCLNESLTLARTMIVQGERDAARIIKAIRQRIEVEAEARIDYVQVVSMDRLEALDRIEPENTLIALAVFVGTTRLIDNIRP